ncbi:sensor histidine kinase [Flavobacterium quisquiliarum]|uniref:histidine kinase n=1 Tax=Flavobacterium quisquiliarum TaxID=1834436 RepID=A0ABV8W2N7_9FLAO|nr:HAMP domain-containing sensor histidine kinase [Flavobacterium quisquiliarum]MBW1655890.1 GHKL domain-containing protein [Flavobacterium quisquiliarum]NWL01363.1 two-component sensor histidine kinase [Flavobacterium collinsii]
MNKLFFRILVLLMSLSLIGIILVQVFWFNSSFKNNEEQFKYHVTQVIGNVADKLEKQEQYKYFVDYNNLKNSTGKEPKKEDLLEVYYVQRNSKTNKTIVYSNTLSSEDYGINNLLFNKKFSSDRFKSFNSKRVTEIYNSNSIIDQNSLNQSVIPDIRIEKSGTLEMLSKMQRDIAVKDFTDVLPIEERVKKEKLQSLLKKELAEYGVKTKFEFGVLNNGVPTKIRSDGFHYDKNASYQVPVFTDNEGNSKYELYITFPNKKKFLLSELLSITILSIVFTLIIIVAYTSALNQLLRQKHISEIKTDFINNMTHEFKTPIATINLALDAIRSPKVIEDKEKVYRYLQMIRDENKRMHAQVENVLRISKLEKRELDITKEPTVVTDIIDDAIEHVNLILEDRQGTVERHYDAARTTVLINEVHFTNVLVNILENAIKYSPDTPKIEVFTENVKDMILIKVRDHGLGMSKIAQKRVFEKFYREHTGDLHNVKGHGLGLAYVKRIVEDHNGQVYVESEKGKGSTFIIKIPLIN